MANANRHRLLLLRGWAISTPYCAAKLSYFIENAKKIELLPFCHKVDNIRFYYAAGLQRLIPTVDRHCLRATYEDYRRS
ncbi:hypothetical protein LJB83_03105 [Clostridia bacterium OttesenSCG-928-F22]|nr:hypothetical protein [Clostridia bacterium OttesenSCG-928-F22]